MPTPPIIANRPDHDALLRQLRTLEVEVARLRASLAGADAVTARAFPPSFTMLVFRAGQLGLGVLTDSVREVIRVVRVDPIAGAPAAVLGSLNFRGSLVPLLDLGHRLTGEYTPCTLDTPIVVVQRPAGLLGLLVDRVLRVDDVKAGELRAPRGELAIHPAFAGTVERDTHFVHVLDAELVLATEESDRLSRALHSATSEPAGDALEGES